MHKCIDNRFRMNTTYFRPELTEIYEVELIFRWVVFEFQNLFLGLYREVI